MASLPQRIRNGSRGRLNPSWGCLVGWDSVWKWGRHSEWYFTPVAPSRNTQMLLMGYRWQWRVWLSRPIRRSTPGSRTMRRTWQQDIWRRTARHSTSSVMEHNGRTPSPPPQRTPNLSRIIPTDSETYGIYFGEMSGTGRYQGGY